MTHEDFYDAEIAPKLLELAKACEDRGIPFLAQVEYAPGEYSRTEFLPPKACIAQRMATWAARANGNFDLIGKAVADYARQHGHNSIFLSQMGVPNIPGPFISALPTTQEKNDDNKS